MVKQYIFRGLALWVSLSFLCQAWASEIKDSESSSHGDKSADYQLVNTYKYPGFEVLQFNLQVLSHYSYLLISDGKCLAIDPGRDAAVYIKEAKSRKVKITGVFLTHSHADFIAGHIELADSLKCPIYMNKACKADFPHKSLQDGSALKIGNALIKFVETPGHTPDGMCAFVYGNPPKTAPDVIFTGDTLFVGSVGRPDLIGGDMPAAKLASMMFDSWNNKLAKAGDSAIIFPAHGAGSLCGAHLSDKPFSTIGEEKKSNIYLAHKSRNDFISAVLEDLPEAPQYFKHNAALNRKGPELVDWSRSLPLELPLASVVPDDENVYIIDLRKGDKYAEGHIPNSVNIGLRGRLETWTGIMALWGKRLILTGSKDEVLEALQRLPRVGYKPEYILIDTWIKAGKPLNKSELIAPEKLYGMMKQGKAPMIVDVRLPNEWIGLRIGNVINMPLNRLDKLSAKLEASEPVVAVCNSAYRSSMGVGILEKQGFKKVYSLKGGGEAWIKQGLPVYGSDSSKGASVKALRELKLAERISAADLKRMTMDIPDSFEIVDIRPPVYFSDYKIEGSKNVDISELINNPAYLTGAGPLVIVDRDGSLAMMIAGILSQKTQRPIKALHGGLEAYWTESEFQPQKTKQQPDAPEGKPFLKNKLPSPPKVNKLPSAGC